jgi:hypothetical protein
VVVMTGRPANLDGRRPGPREVCLLKPFGPPRLAAAVGELMDGPVPPLTPCPRRGSGSGGWSSRSPERRDVGGKPRDLGALSARRNRGGEAQAVYALLRKSKLAEPGGADEAARRARDGIVPILKGRPGFRLHLGFVSERSETVGVTLYDGREPALEALERARAWAAEHMRDLAPGEP